jgi:hypothetical protein
MKEPKDIIMVAYPALGYAEMESGSARGFAFMRERWGKALGVRVLSDDIRDMFDNLKAENITYRLIAR